MSLQVTLYPASKAKPVIMSQGGQNTGPRDVCASKGSVVTARETAPEFSNTSHSMLLTL